MTVSHTNALELLGKDVSFVFERKVRLTDSSFITRSETSKGVVTNVLLSLSREAEISINDGDFYSLSELLDFQMLSN